MASGLALPARVSAWALAVALFCAALAPPLMSEDVCITKEWKDHPWRSNLYKTSSRAVLLSSGSDGVPNLYILATVSLAAWLPVFFVTRQHRIDAGNELHRWARYYATAVSLQGVMYGMFPWVIMACPQGMLGTTVLYTVTHSCGLLCYVASQGMLMQVALLRLRLVAAPLAAARAAILRWVVLVAAAFGVAGHHTLGPLFRRCAHAFVRRASRARP